MTLYKRGNVYWSYVSVNGVRHGKSTGTGNRKLAETVDHDFKHELTFVRQHAPQLQPEMEFADLAARFLGNAGQKTWHLDRLKILLPFFEGYRIGAITRNTTLEYRVWRHRQKKISETTVNRDLECLRRIMFWAVDEGLLIRNPLSRMPLVRERRKRRSVISVQEELLLLNAAAPHLKLIIIAAVDTGMRRGEITQQDWQDIDWSRRLLFVSHSKTPEGEAREIPLTQRLFAVLESSRRAEGKVFTFKGRPITRIKTGWKAALRRAGIRHYRFHDLRHAFNTRLMEAGVMQEIRKALMGHSSGEDVNSIYTHVELPAKRDAIRKLEVWIEQQNKSGGDYQALPGNTEEANSGAGDSQ